jgi:Co/Zn/Cd efflux system component
MESTSPSSPRLRRAVVTVALANLSYFCVEAGVARRIGSVSLFADSVDFLEDASVNFLVAVAIAWPPRRRARVGMVLSGLLLVPALAALWTAWQKLAAPTPPAPWALTTTGLGALGVNLACAFLLARFRHDPGSLATAAFLSARNDALANIAIVAAGVATLRWQSGWPDLIVGLGIACLNASAAREVWSAARREQASPRPTH